MRPIFVPTAWSMPYKPPLVEPVTPLYPRDILTFKPTPEKTLAEIRASQSSLLTGLKSSVFSNGPPVPPATRQKTGLQS